MLRMHTQVQSRPRFEAVAVCAVALALALAAACVSREPADPLMNTRLLSVDAKAFDRLLDQAGQLQGTPLARQAEQLQKRLEGCSQVWGQFEALETAGSRTDGRRQTDAMGCAATASPDVELLNAAKQLRGDHAGLLIWPLGDEGRIEIRFNVDADGGIQVDGLAIPPAQQNAWRLLIPGDKTPAPPVLAAEQALLYARVRPAGGLALAQLIPSGSQADRLFALKGRLLEGALLDGTWEFAFMPPAAGTDLPLATLALHHRRAGPVREALREALAQLEQTWPIRQTARTFTTSDGRSHEGGCYLELPLLPGLAPCWVVTDDALFVAYQDKALRTALASPASDDSDFGGLDVRLARFVPSAATGASNAILRPGDLYSRLQIDFDPTPDGNVALRGALKAAR